MDSPRAAVAALGVRRPGTESTHVLCRHEDEGTSDFASRVLRRVARIQRSHGIRAVSYVVGSEESDARPLPLLSSLLEMLSAGSSLTLVGPGTHQAAAFDWLAALMHVHPEVTVGVKLYPQAGDDARQPVAKPFKDWGREATPGVARSRHPAPRFRVLHELEPSFALADSA